MPCSTLANTQQLYASIATHQSDLKTSDHILFDDVLDISLAKIVSTSLA